MKARLGYLDGVRGLAALFVLLHHGFFQVLLDKTSPPLSPFLARSFAFMAYGPTAVIVFIVLSGFCLMLPVVNASDGKPRGGWRQYFRRRATRILPPYYVALLLTLALIWLIPGLQQPMGRAWDTAVPALLLKPIVAHLLLVHDFIGPYFVRIDPPMWSVALEWHIYFLFPLLLLIGRKFGMGVAVVVGMILGYLPHKLTHGVLDFAKFHYIGLFAIGMAACWIALSTKPAVVRYRSKLPWGWITVLLSGLSLFTIPRNFGSLSAFGLPDYLPALASASLLIYCSVSSHLDTARGSRLVRLLETFWCRQLGHFSYSLYLIHYPLLAAIYLVLLRILPSPELRLAALWFLCCPLILCVSYGFYLAFERPFTPAFPQREQAVK